MAAIDNDFPLTLSWTERVPTIVSTMVWSDALGEYVLIEQHETKELHPCDVTLTIVQKDDQ